MIASAETMDTNRVKTVHTMVEEMREGTMGKADTGIITGLTTEDIKAVIAKMTEAKEKNTASNSDPEYEEDQTSEVVLYVAEAEEALEMNSVENPDSEVAAIKE